MSSQGLLIQSLEKGLMVLNTFRDHESLNLQEISRCCGITIGSAQRVAHTLEQAGYLYKDPRGKRYRVTIKAVGLGYNYLSRDPLFQRAHAVLHQINQQCGEIVNLSVPDEDHMVFVMRVAPARHVPFYLPTGTRIPCLASASGRAVWSHLPPDALQARLDGMVMRKHTPHTTTDPVRLRQLIEEARVNRYAYAEDEFFLGDINVAAAVLDSESRPIAAVNLSVPRPRWSLARAREELAPLVIQAARAIGSP